MEKCFVFLLLLLGHQVGVFGQGENICDSDVCAQICNPTDDSYKCDCIKGFVLMEDGISCKPEKRALKKGGRCELTNPCEQDCTDTGIAIKCSCREGYELAGDGKSCKDIDECKLGIHECLETEDCENEIGTYACYDKEVFGENEIDYDKKCPTGYRFDIEKGVCDDINECQFELMCVAPKVCKNTIGSFFCENPIPTCPPGFSYDENVEKCEDIDECEKKTATCLGSETCVNEPGSYSCINISIESSTTTTTVASTTKFIPTCPKGHKFSTKTDNCEDINECSAGTHDCDVLERCDNTIGSYHCSRIYGCGTGYTLNVANGLCEDDDECLLGTHNCMQLGVNFRCKNTLGSYRCEPVRVPKIYPKPVQSWSTVSTTTWLPRTRKEQSTTTEPSSLTPTDAAKETKRLIEFSNSTTTPTYYTKWDTKTTSSTTNQSQRNNLSSIAIVFQTAPTTQRVVPHYFYRSPTTTNIAPKRFPTRQHTFIGGQLKQCLPGYRLNSQGDCEDIDECEGNPCAKNHRCLNVNGNFQCIAPMTCKMGYELNESGDACIDVDECKTGLHKCHSTQICRNYAGFHVCECPPGHQPRFDRCEDIDECRMFRPCSASAHCVNTKGSYRCDCKDGFRRNGNTCEEINECNENIGLCEQKCVNVWGSYRCSCSAGFHLNPDNRTCTDIDECERFKDKRLCIGKCKNIPGSYTCECPKGYQLGSDGRICRDIDECQQNVCLKDEVCLNLKGSFRCYSIKCPENYIKDPEHKTRCKRLQQFCDIRDYQCLMMPTQYAYQYLAMVSNLPINNGPVQIIEIKGPAWFSAKAEFAMTLVDVICPRSIQKVDDTYFQKRQERVNSMTIYLVKPIQGPQEVKIKIEMKFFNGNVLMGNNIVFLIVVVSEHSF